MLQKRNQMDKEKKTEYDIRICQLLLDYIEMHSIKVVHAYIPMAGEIDIKTLLEILLSRNITVVCSKTLPKRQLENRILKDLYDLETGIKGTLHPKEADIYYGTYQLIIVPGLAFDDNLYRLGYGGAYYDTFIRSQKGAKTIGIFYPFQKIENVPIEHHDLQLNSILTLDDHLQEQMIQS